MEGIKSARHMQYMAAIAASFSNAIGGTFATWPSPTLPILTSNDSPVGRPITTEEGSWIVSLFVITPIFITWPMAWILEKFGRRISLLISVIPPIIGWLMIIFGDSVIVICIARFFAGTGTSLASVTASVYVGEIAEKDIRGKLGSIFNLMRLVGSLLVLSIGPFVSYYTITWICFAVPVVFFIIFFPMPESPYYLVKVGKLFEARQNLIRLSSKGATTDFIDKQMLEIEVTVKNDMANKTSFRTILRKEFRKSLFIIIGIKMLQQFSGTVAIDAYMQTIIQASGSDMSPEVSSIVYGVIQIPAVFMTAAVVDKLGRKPVLIISALSVAAALMSEGIYFFLQDSLHQNVDKIGWLPTTGLVVFAVMSNFGVYTLPYVFVGELFATNIKGIASSIALSCGGLLAFIVSKCFEPLSEAWGRYTMFWIFCGCCVIGSLFVYFVVPETKGKTFAEIQDKLNRKRIKPRDEVEFAEDFVK